MKGKIRTLTDRMPIRTLIASVFVAAVAAVGTPAGPPSAHATHSRAEDHDDHGLDS